MPNVTFIPNYTLKCSFGELELLLEVADKAEHAKARIQKQLFRRASAQRLRIKFQQRMAVKKEEYKISLLAIDALALYELMVVYRYLAKGEWKKATLVQHIDLIRGHYNEYVDL